MKYDSTTMGCDVVQPLDIRSTLKGFDEPKPLRRRHFMSLDDLSGGSTQVHVVYDDTELDEDALDDDMQEEIWVSCCGLAKAAEWPSIPFEKQSDEVERRLSRQWKSVNCFQDMCLEPRSTTAPTPPSDSSSEDSLEFESVVYDVPRKISGQARNSFTRADLFRHKSNPNLSRHDSDSASAAVDFDHNRYHYERVPSDDPDLLSEFIAGCSTSSVFHELSSDDLHLNRRGVLVPLSHNDSVERARLNRFNSVDVISPFSSLSEVEEISASEENIYMELTEPKVHRKKEGRFSPSKKKKNLKSRISDVSASLAGRTPKRYSPPFDTPKRFVDHKETSKLKKRLNTLLKTRAPLYAKIQKCPPVERAQMNRANVPLPAVPPSKVRVSLVEDPYSQIKDDVDLESSSASENGFSSTESTENLLKTRSCHNLNNFEESVYMSPECCSCKPPQLNFSSHPTRSKSSLTLNLDSSLDQLNGNALFSPVFCCGKSSPGMRMNIEHMYKEKCSDFDYDIPRTALTSPREEFHPANLEKFKPKKEVDGRPEEEKMQELDQLLHAIHAYITSHSDQNILQLPDSNFAFSSTVSENNPKFINPVEFYKSLNIPLTLVNSVGHDCNNKPLYAQVIKKKDRKTAANTAAESAKIETFSFPSTDAEDYEEISEEHLAKMAKRELNFLVISLLVCIDRLV